MIFLFMQNAFADSLDELRLTAMSDWDNRPYTSSDSRQLAFLQVSKQLGAAISTPNLPAHTLGIWGLEFGIHQGFSFIDTQKTLDNSPSAWALLTPDEDLFPVLVHPKLFVRKGLPLSTEVEIALGYLLFSRQSTIGGAFRIAPIEGHPVAPDIAVQIGYNAYISNPEIGLGTLDTSFILSKRFGFGYLNRMTTAHFVPFFAVGTTATHVSPKISQAQQGLLSVGPLSGFSSSPYYTEELSRIFVNPGIRLENQEFSFQVDYRYSIDTLNILNIAMAWRY